MVWRVFFTSPPTRFAEPLESDGNNAPVSLHTGTPALGALPCPKGGANPANEGSKTTTERGKSTQSEVQGAKHAISRLEGHARIEQL